MKLLHISLSLVVAFCCGAGKAQVIPPELARDHCCTALQVALPGRIIRENRNSSIPFERYWAVQNAEVVTACRVFPRNAEEVSTAVKILKAAHDQKIAGCNFAVRSGGHTAFAQSGNNIANGVAIDLSGLKTVETSADRSIISIGPGNRWFDVYAKMDPQNLTVVGGRSKTVGVAGLVLGGGMSFYSPRLGMPCDNVANYEVILASGEIANANASSNPDLYKALKGGANNFGVVTRLDMTAVENNGLYGGMVFYDMATLPQHFPAFEQYTRNASVDVNAQVTLLYGWIGNVTFAQHHRHSTIPDQTSFESGFRVFDNIPIQKSTIRHDTLANFAIELESSGVARRSFATHTYTVNAAFMGEVFKLAEVASSTIKQVAGGGLIITSQPFAQVLTSKSTSNGRTGNNLGLDSSDGDLMIVMSSTDWTNASDDALVTRTLQTFWEAVEVKAAEMGVANEYVFLNYAEVWQDPVKGLGAAGLAAMQAASKKYDPTGLFQTGLTGGFKLFKQENPQ